VKAPARPHMVTLATLAIGSLSAANPKRDQVEAKDNLAHVRAVAEMVVPLAVPAASAGSSI